MTKRFPRTEPDIAALAARVIDGLTSAAEDFPTPPVPTEELRGKLEAVAKPTGEIAVRDAPQKLNALG